MLQSALCGDGLNFQPKDTAGWLGSRTFARGNHEHYSLAFRRRHPARIKESRAKGKSAATLAEKLEHQKEQRALEATRDKKRRELFDRQDEIQQRRDQLIEELERQLKQRLEERLILCCTWELS